MLKTFLTTQDQNSACILSSKVQTFSPQKWKERYIIIMRNGKASGIDNISKEMLQAMGDFGMNILTVMCNKMYHNIHIPEDLRTSIFKLLPKKQRAVDCSNFRTISLMCHTLKLLLTIILRRISDKINRGVGREQAQFRKNSGKREAIFCLRNLTEKYLGPGLPPHSVGLIADHVTDTTKLSVARMER
ncbi:endonuclease-reverse transcriptase [Elysia marginata]|uniref:Endonuclease-reverse transcriptase n=1 Tax=Elysia marginata TaxID=1093978 RepID=A0AAV4H255_9GAST|nr:endonuclease-reverse transcriptase [Elysia marginata]